MVNVFIFHGVGGSSSENWFPWMKAELQAAGHTVIVPDFPHPNRPQLDEWLKSFEQYKHLLSEDSVLVGHSLGGAFALRLLQSWNVRVLATFLVASVWGVMDNEFDPLMRTFTETSYDWQRINQYAGEIHILHSDNDPYIKLAKAE
ncbi:alpha/beta fold hydrolase, partial [Candidatus Peribacteria bacterium]|nr:alpha/beta fold hydrolase [Candidatus Peribacteria bacterium]